MRKAAVRAECLNHAGHGVCFAIILYDIIQAYRLGLENDMDADDDKEHDDDDDDKPDAGDDPDESFLCLKVLPGITHTC